MRQIKLISSVLRGFCLNPFTVRGTAVAQWLRCCAANRKVDGLIQDGVTEIFNGHKESNRTLTLKSSQPLTEMSTRIIFWG